MSHSSNAPYVIARFSIDSVEQNCPGQPYGESAWTIINNASDVEQLRGLTRLYEGDSCLANEYVYCIAFQNADEAVLSRIQERLKHDTEFRKVADRTPFASYKSQTQFVALSLVHVANVKNGEVETVRGTYLRGVIAKARANRRQRDAATESLPIHVAASQRPVPASTRTRSLPPFTTRDELVRHLHTRFGAAPTYGAFLTPEELCDVVDHYSGATQAFLSRRFDNGEELTLHLVARIDLPNDPADQTWVTDRGILFRGLTEFASAADAINYCRKSIGDANCVDAWRIRGKYSLNFLMEDQFTESIDRRRPVSATELWSAICLRRLELGIQEDASSSTDRRKNAERQRGSDEPKSRSAQPKKPTKIPSPQQAAAEAPKQMARPNQDEIHRAYVEANQQWGNAAKGYIRLWIGSSLFLSLAISIAFVLSGELLPSQVLGAFLGGTLVTGFLLMIPFAIVFRINNNQIVKRKLRLGGQLTELASESDRRRESKRQRNGVSAEIRTEGARLKQTDHSGESTSASNYCPDCKGARVWVIVGAVSLEPYCLDCSVLCDCGRRFLIKDAERRSESGNIECPSCRAVYEAMPDQDRVTEWMRLTEATGGTPRVVELLGRIGPAGRRAIPLLQQLFTKHGKSDFIGCAAFDALREHKMNKHIT